MFQYIKKIFNKSPNRLSIINHSLSSLPICLINCILKFDYYFQGILYKNIKIKSTNISTYNLLNNRILITDDTQGKFMILDLITNKLINLPFGQRSYLFYRPILVNNTIIFLTRDDTIEFYDLNNYKNIKSIKLLQKDISDFRLISDDEIIVISDDKYIIYNILYNTHQIFPIPSNIIVPFQRFNSNNAFAFTNEFKLSIISLITGKIINTDFKVFNFRVFPSGKVLCISENIFIFDPQDSSRKILFKNFLNIDQNNFLLISDNKVCFIGNNNTLLFIDTETLITKTLNINVDIKRLLLSPDGKIICTTNHHIIIIDPINYIIDKTINIKNRIEYVKVYNNKLLVITEKYPNSFIDIYE